MVSKKIADSCYPVTVKMGKQMKNGTLILNVRHGKELEIEYEKKEIIDKINSFFGYSCISQVTLRIVQDKLKSQDKTFSRIQNFTKIEKKMKMVKNVSLKNSLSNFVKAFNEKNK
mgnify:FL=1